MIKGIGTDLIEIGRVEKACKKEAFLARYFTYEEIAFMKGNARKSAGNFAVKEAVSKVLGTGFSGFGPKDIEVLRDERGKPYVNLYGGAKKRADELHIKNMYVTISNTKELVSAFAVGEDESI
ncbi:holo-ACP synthase [Anaerobium acetethylicum]|uniref:Holo-[acyl-carrier-protein] synthase n=1 Tax=Anaerobium acetethylicum TaxID=1619234 RepID=A0A1D3TP57_9FIRM|nr:holo-ACP synthase [Anaerobium acetethylicum]SCP95166.1 holo-[acyl-carrier protein] synthase [Anaerobium acetethylicum]